MNLVSLVSNFAHPILMLSLLAVSLYTSYLGVQVWRTRTAQGDLKKQLIKGRFNIRHYQVGSILLALIVIGAFGGMASTYIGTGQLYLDSHLLSGLGIVALISSSAALSPLMQKGNKWARYTHIFLNSILLGLFIWQGLTGIQIVQEILHG